MVAIQLEHSNLAQHQGNIFKQLQTFRKEGKLCDVVLKSIDGKEHRAHTAILCAASADLKTLLLGSFLEANQVQEGQPVEMAASAAVVFALLEYIYGGHPQVELEDSLELLRLADAYNFLELASAIEVGLRASLDGAPVATALKLLQFLQLNQDLHDLTAACEDKVAANFESCIDMVGFLELSAGQLCRILQRDDLNVPQEEVVVEGLFNWLNSSDGSEDRSICLGALLRNVDFNSLSSSNLARLGQLSASMGRIGHDLQREVGEALRAHKKRSASETPEAFQPKRRCLQHWSPDLGASCQAPCKVLPFAFSMCYHDGAIYYINDLESTVFRWNPGDSESQAVAGIGARVSGVNDFAGYCSVSVSPEGEIFVSDYRNDRLLRFRNGSGSVVLSDAGVRSVFCAPSGSVYVTTQGGTAVQKLVGEALQPLISSEHLPEQLRFEAADLFVTKEEAIYLSDYLNERILRLNPGESEPVVVSAAPAGSNVEGLYVTEDGKIYVADNAARKVWALYCDNSAWTEVAQTRSPAFRIVAQGRELWVSVGDPYEVEDDGDEGDEYSLPPKFQLDTMWKTKGCLRRQVSLAAFHMYGVTWSHLGVQDGSDAELGFGWFWFGLLLSWGTLKFPGKNCCWM